MGPIVYQINKFITRAIKNQSFQNVKFGKVSKGIGGIGDLQDLLHF